MPIVIFRRHSFTAHTAPRHGCHRACEQNRVWTAEEVEQRNNSQASQRAAQKVRSVEPRNVPRFPRKENRELDTGYEKGHGGDQIDRRKPEKIGFATSSAKPERAARFPARWDDQRVNDTKP